MNSSDTNVDKVPKKRALTLLKQVSDGQEAFVDVLSVPNPSMTMQYVRLHLDEFPSLFLSQRRFLMPRRHRLRYVVKRVIHQNRRRCNLWFRTARKAVIHYLAEQFDAEYDLGLRSGPRQSKLKAECTMFESFPHISAMSADPPLVMASGHHRRMD